MPSPTPGPSWAAGCLPAFPPHLPTGTRPLVPWSVGVRGPTGGSSASASLVALGGSGSPSSWWQELSGGQGARSPGQGYRLALRAQQEGLGRAVAGAPVPVAAALGTPAQPSGWPGGRGSHGGGHSLARVVLEAMVSWRPWSGWPAPGGGGGHGQLWLPEHSLRYR